MEESDTERDRADVRSVVDRYAAAITAGDEAAATPFTCEKKDGGLLWVGAVGRNITVLGVQVWTQPDTRARRARVRIRVEGKPHSVLLLRQVGDTWCVWP